MSLSKYNGKSIICDIKQLLDLDEPKTASGKLYQKEPLYTDVRIRDVTA